MYYLTSTTNSWFSVENWINKWLVVQCSSTRSNYSVYHWTYDNKLKDNYYGYCRCNDLNNHLLNNKPNRWNRTMLINEYYVNSKDLRTSGQETISHFVANVFEGDVYGVLDQRRRIGLLGVRLVVESHRHWHWELLTTTQPKQRLRIPSRENKAKTRVVCKQRAKQARIRLALARRRLAEH